MEREQIIKALEWCIQSESCEYCGYRDNVDVCSIRSDALAVIKKQEDQIFKLESCLKECENGYEGTLHLERCKLHDEEEKVRELSVENEKIGIENFNLICELSRIKEDTVKKMQEQIKTELINTYGSLPHTYYFFKVVDKIAKEVKGEG